jgi:hypothetical protein
VSCSWVQCHLYCIFQAIRTLSCEARNQSVYVVVNVPEVAPCDNGSSNCVVYYNSNVAFDRNGTIVARWGSSLIMFISITLRTASMKTTYIALLQLILMMSWFGMWRPVVWRMGLNISDTALTIETTVHKYAMALHLTRQTRFFSSISIYISIIEDLDDGVIQLCTPWHRPVRPKHVAVFLLKHYCTMGCW